MIHIRVPATSANLGPGFDSAGLALQLYNDVYMEEWDGVSITSLDETAVPTGENNLIYATAKDLFQRCGRPFYGLKIQQETRIPMTRGLGSSTACLVAGLAGANCLMGSPLSQQDIVNLSAVLEGHPDNTTPAVVGGYINAVLENERVCYAKQTPCSTLGFTVMIPPFQMKTSFARSVLPREVTMEDAVYNTSRAALLSWAIPAGDIDCIRVALGDTLHEPYRIGLIEGGELARAMAAELGAYGVVISGAGSTLLAVHAAQDCEFSLRMEEQLIQAGITGWKLQTLPCDMDGVCVNILD